MDHDIDISPEIRSEIVSPKRGRSKGGGLRDTAVDRRDLYYYYADQIEPMPGLNVRDWPSVRMQNRVRDIAESIMTNGVEEPIVVIRKSDVEGGKHVYIKSGETRWRAVMLLAAEGRVPLSGPGAIQIPAIPGRDRSEIDDTADLIVYNDQMPFSPLEILDIFRRLDGWNMSKSEIARRIGKKPSFVNSLWPLMKAGHDIREMLREDVISPSTAVNALRFFNDDDKRAAQYLKKQIDKDKSRREADKEEAQRELAAAEAILALERTNNVVEVSEATEQTEAHNGTVVCDSNESEDAPILTSDPAVYTSTAPKKRPGGRKLSEAEKVVAEAKKKVDRTTQAASRVKIRGIAAKNTWITNSSTQKLFSAIRLIGLTTIDLDTFIAVNHLLAEFKEAPLDRTPPPRRNPGLVDPPFEMEEVTPVGADT